MSHSKEDIKSNEDLLLLNINDIKRVINNEFSKLPLNKNISQSIINEIIKINNSKLTINDNKKDSSQFKKLVMNWHNIILCIKHEMWSKLASVINAMVNDKDEKEENKIDLNDLSDECIDNLLLTLKEERHLPIEERQYLRKLIIRARDFDLTSCYQTKEMYQIQETNSHVRGLNASLLMDIFDVHRIFLFSKFNFREYDVKEYQCSVMERATKILGEKFVEAHLSRCINVSFRESFNLYPNHLVHDDIFRVFDYHFGVSFLVNKLKKQLTLVGNQCFEIKSIVIPQSVKCMYDSNIEFNCGIESIEDYLHDKHVRNFYKIRCGKDNVKAPQCVSDKIEKNYNINNVFQHKISKLIVIVDRRLFNYTQDDSLYVFPCDDKDQFLELDTNYFVSFNFKIVPKIYGHGNKVIAHFRYGVNEISRFYPEMLISVIPTIFAKSQESSEPQILDKMYANNFKHGFCVTLYDKIFNDYYKIFTSFDHVSVNYNRQILYEEFNKEKPLLCFMDLLNYELTTNSEIHDIQSIRQFFINNEYDTESIIDDVLFENTTCNIQIHLHPTSKFEAIRNIICKYNRSTTNGKASLCNKNHVLSVNECGFVEVIANALNEMDQGNDCKDLSLSLLLEAYDHIVSVHRFFEQMEDDEENMVKPFEEIDHEKHVSNVQTYLVEIFDYCELEKCPKLHQHLTRTREQDSEQLNSDNDTLNEIRNATLNALHCYILHKRKELFRLQRSNTHFITPVMDENEAQNYIEEQKHDKNSNNVPSIHFGVSVLQWLEYSENPRFSSFYEEIINNEKSTITEQIFLNLSQECYIKMNNNKSEQYQLEELIALKIYTDADTFQTALRQSFWKSAGKEVKKSFYRWALLLYQAAAYHAKLIPRATFQSDVPKQLYHGLNRILVLDNERPKYNGALSTSLKQSVAYSFSKGKGLLWTIRPSFANKFEFLVGIPVDWISQYKNEAEILLINQYLPITAAVNFDTDPKNNVDHLMYTVQTYKKQILDVVQFYNILGRMFTDSWIPFIKEHNLLFVKTDFNPNRRVLDVLIEDLKIQQLHAEHQVLSSLFVLVKSYKAFNYCSFKMQVNERYVNKIAKHFEQTEYKLTYSNNKTKRINIADILTVGKNRICEDKSCKIYVKNKTLFGFDDFMLLQKIHDKNVQMNDVNNFANCLELQNDKIIVPKIALINPKHCEEILKAKYRLNC
eukprot:228693_1